MKSNEPSIKTMPDQSSVDTSTTPWHRGLAWLLRCDSRRERERRVNYSTHSNEITEEKQVELDFSWLKYTGMRRDFKVLLVFPRCDQQSELLVAAAKELGWKISEARNAEEAAQLFRTTKHDLIIIDRRSSSRCHEADEICRILSELVIPFSTIIVAMIKKTFFTFHRKNEENLLLLLNIGYNRALMECSHMAIIMNELIGIYSIKTMPKSQLVTAQLLYQTIDTFQSTVHITNDRHIIQFANKANEKNFNIKREDLIGKKIQNFLTFENFALTQLHLQRGKEFHGNVVWKSKGKGPLYLNCSIVPIAIPISQVIFYIYCYDNISKAETISTSISFHNFTGVENQLEPEIMQTTKTRSTVTKLHNFLLDSPITKVISLLSYAVKECDDPSVYIKIETAIQILKSTEYYVPQVKEENVTPLTDPHITDIIESLIPPNDNLLKGRTFSLKESTIVTFNSIQNQTNAKLFKSPRGPDELEILLENHFNWDFDIFQLEYLTNRRPLFYLGMTFMEHYKVAERLNCDEQTLQNWLTIMEANYNIHVSYHNSTHATDVLQATARFMSSNKLQMILEPLDEVAALLAAIAHDIGHPGKSSQFLCNASNKLAILYNDLTVLESHHSALTFKITLSDDNVNIFKNLNRNAYQAIRQNVIDMILATEMSKHFEHLVKFVNVYSSPITDDESITECSVEDISVYLLPENLTLIKRMMIKCADISNPTRPMKLYIEWTKRIAEEYFNQTDEEKRKRMPVVMPKFDRSGCSIPKLQIGFVDYIINDMMEAWDAFIDMPELIGNMRHNYEKWKIYHELGIKTIEDIEKLQQVPELQIYKNIVRPSV